MSKKFSFIGYPGAGKGLKHKSLTKLYLNILSGTFAKIICERYGFSHLSVGDLARKEVATSSAIGLRMKTYMDRGHLVPDDIINQLLFNKLHSCETGYIIDGYPRSLIQATKLREVEPNICPVHIILDEDVSIAKLLGRKQCQGCKRSFNLAHVVHNGYDMPAILPDPLTCPLGSKACHQSISPNSFESRDDDTLETIKSRFEVFRNETTPVIDYFKQLGILRTFDVKKGIKDVDALIETMLI